MNQNLVTEIFVNADVALIYSGLRGEVDLSPLGHIRLQTPFFPEFCSLLQCRVQGEELRICKSFVKIAPRYQREIIIAYQ